MLGVLFRSSDKKLNITDSITHGTYSFFVHIFVFVDQFGLSLRFCHLEFDKEAISDCFMTHFCVLEGGYILSDFRKLSFCGPCFFQLATLLFNTIGLVKTQQYNEYNTW